VNAEDRERAVADRVFGMGNNRRFAATLASLRRDGHPYADA
jgi:hypothetical protein